MRMAADFGAREELVTGDMVTVMVRVDQPRDRFAAANLPGACDEVLRGNRPLQRVDREHVVGADDQPRRSTRLDRSCPGRTPCELRVDVGSELAQSRGSTRGGSGWRKSRARRRRRVDAALRGKLRAACQCGGRSNDDARTSLKRFAPSQSLHRHLLDSTPMLRRVAPSGCTDRLRQA